MHFRRRPRRSTIRRHAQAATQQCIETCEPRVLLTQTSIATADPGQIEVTPGQTVNFVVNYSTTDTDNNNGNFNRTDFDLRLHYNPDQVTLNISDSDVFQTGFQLVGSPQEDDGTLGETDENTTEFIRVAWFDQSGNWPGIQPVQLLRANVVVANNFTGTSTINITSTPGPSGPNQIQFQGTSVMLSQANNNTNARPEITSANSFSVQERSGLGAFTATATDSDPNDTLQYSISGTDAGRFTINQNTGVVQFLTTPDFDAPNDANMDNLYDVVVSVTDGTDTTMQTVTVSVTDDGVGPANNPPVITSGTSFSIVENARSVTTVTSNDPDGDFVTYALSGTDAALFRVDSGGILTFATSPDFENPQDFGQDNVYNVQVVATDDNGGRDIANLAITVTDDPEVAPLGEGNVDVRIVQAGALRFVTLVGDNLSNTVLIEARENGDVFATGVGTTVEGSDQPYRLYSSNDAGLRGDFHMLMGRGHDYVAIDGINVGRTDRPAPLADLRFWGGRGHDTFKLSNANVGGHVVVRGARGRNVAEVADTDVGGSLITSGSGELDVDSTDINKAFIATTHPGTRVDTIQLNDSSVGGVSVIATHGGTDSVQIDETSFGRTVTVATGHGDDNISILNSDFGQALTVSAAAGRDELEFRNNDVAVARLYGGGGNDLAAISDNQGTIRRYSYGSSSAAALFSDQTLIDDLFA